MGTKSSRIAEYRRSHPCLSMAQVGRHFGLSRQRIEQIAKKHGVTTRRLTRDKRNLCVNCGKPTTNKLTCSPECHHAVHWVTITCIVCGKPKEVEQSQILAHAKDPRYTHGGGQFCSRHCNGVYYGTTAGWGVRPEDALKGVATRITEAKWVSDYVWIEHLKTGLNGYGLAKRLGMNHNTVYNIFRRISRRPPLRGVNVHGKIGT